MIPELLPSTVDAIGETPVVELSRMIDREWTTILREAAK